MDGRACVTEMLEAESTHWAQDEWRGWYFEFVGLPALINAFGGGPPVVANTLFDYSLSEIWDLKCHGDTSSTAILNSRAAMDHCLTDRGIGLLVLSGTTIVDDGDFRQWQRDLRIANGKIPKPRTRPAVSSDVRSADSSPGASMPSSSPIGPCSTPCSTRGPWA